MASTPKNPEKPVKWANKFVGTEMPGLYRREGKLGNVYYARVKRGGKIYIKRMGKDFKASKVALRKWLNGVDVKSAAAETNGSDLVTFGDFKRRYLRMTDLDVALADKSKSYRHECCNRITSVWKQMFNDDLDQRKVSHITQEQCMTWASFMTGYHHQTYNNTIATLKNILQEAIEAGLILVNPAAKLKRVGKVRRVNGTPIGEPGELATPDEKAAKADVEEARWYPTPEQFKAIIEKMKSYKFGPVRSASEFAELLAYTGCRLSEAGKLRWKDVDRSKNRIRVNGAKGRAMDDENAAIRFVPINSALSDLLARLEPQAATREVPERIAPVTMCRGTMQRACRDLKLPRQLDHHDLRHWFATCKRRLKSAAGVMCVTRRFKSAASSLTMKHVSQYERLD